MYTTCTQIKDCATCTTTPIPQAEEGTGNCFWSAKDQKCGSWADDKGFPGYTSTCGIPKKETTTQKDTASKPVQSPVQKVSSSYTSCTQISDCTKCTNTPIPDSDGSENCFWSPRQQKCGSFVGNGYGSTCKEGEGFIDTIKNFSKSIQYAGKNIKTSDGTIAYVTDTGLVKGYTDVDSYTGTVGQYGCPTITENVNQTWANLKFPTGSVMAKGQACGNETKYVAPAPPENAFDAPWYRQAYPKLRLETDADALADWTTRGQAAGRLPNATILTSMASLGKVGYVDANAVLHNIPTYTYKGIKPFLQRSNVTGTHMKDCAAGNSVKYGDRIVLVCNDKKAYLTSDSVTQFDTKKQMVFIVRPPVGSDLNGFPVQYGDSVSLTLAMTNYSDKCGYWGCKVGNIDKDTMLFMFGPGGSTGGSMLKVNPHSAAYTKGQNVAYDTPFLLSGSVIAPNNALFQGDIMKPVETPLESTDGEYYLTYRADGKLAFYHGETLVWESGTSSTKPKMARISKSGNVELVDTDNYVYWSTGTKGSSPVALAVQTDGRLVLYDGSMRELWGQGTLNGEDDVNANIVYAGVSSDKMVFSESSSHQKTFSFRTEDGTTPLEKCDVVELRKQCGKTCVGFIHDPKTNEWQTIDKSSQATDFKITNTVQDVYMKVPQLSFSDATCKTGPATFMDAGTYAHYVTGDDITCTGKNQCAKSDPRLEEDHQNLIDKREEELENVEQDAYDFDNSPLNELTDAATENHDKAKDRIVELRMKARELKKSKGNLTLRKQAEDSDVVDRQAKLRAIIWAILALVAVGILIVWRFGVVYGVLYTAMVVGALYLFYRLM